MFETERERAVEGIAALGHGLVEGLSNRLNEINNPLRQEAEEQRVKAAKLRQSYEELKPRAESRTRILATEIDAALSEGRDSDAEAKRKEAAELEASLQEILRQTDACQARVRELAEQQKANARDIFNDTYPAMPQAAHAVIESVVDLLDGLEDGLRRFVEVAGIQGTFPYLFLKQRHIDNLIPNTMNGGRELMVRVDRRFGDKR